MVVNVVIVPERPTPLSGLSCPYYVTCDADKPTRRIIQSVTVMSDAKVAVFKWSAAVLCPFSCDKRGAQSPEYVDLSMYRL